jgi:hypothetical protein
MFDSGIKVKDLIDQINAEADIALDIPDKNYVQWLNSLQQLLYTEVIKEQKKTVLKPPFESTLIDVSELLESGENAPRFEDIHAVYSGDIQLIKSTVASGFIFPNTYFKYTNKLGFRADDDKDITIIYFVKPELINHDDIGDSKVMIPVEFIDLAKAKLRGEAYKLANEDSLAAKWLHDYNVILETFKAWIATKSSDFGI